MNRRMFLRVTSTIFLAIQFTFLNLKESKAEKSAKDNNLIDEQDTMAKALKYHHDAAKAPAIRTNKKAFCYNCAKYNLCMDGDTGCKTLTAKALEKAQAAPCQLFKGKNVTRAGWCLSWQARS